MSTPSLSEFQQIVVEKNRITSADVRRLRRDVLPDGVSTREEAEVLILLDRSVRRIDPAWSEYLVAEIVHFVVWADRPTGYVDPGAVQWLLACLWSERPTQTAARIAREIVREAEEAGPDLVAFAFGHAGVTARTTPRRLAAA